MNFLDEKNALNDLKMSLKHSKLVLIDQKLAQNDQIWSNYKKILVEFVRIRSKSSNSSKFDIRIWDLEFEISKFERIRPSLEKTRCNYTAIFLLPEIISRLSFSLRNKHFWAKKTDALLSKFCCLASHYMMNHFQS